MHLILKTFPLIVLLKDKPKPNHPLQGIVLIWSTGLKQSATKTTPTSARRLLKSTRLMSFQFGLSATAGVNQTLSSLKRILMRGLGQFESKHQTKLELAGEIKIFGITLLNILCFSFRCGFRKYLLINFNSLGVGCLHHPSMTWKLNAGLTKLIMTSLLTTVVIEQLQKSWNLFWVSWKLKIYVSTA